MESGIQEKYGNDCDTDLFNAEQSRSLPKSEVDAAEKGPVQGLLHLLLKPLLVAECTKKKAETFLETPFIEVATSNDGKQSSSTAAPKALLASDS